MHNQDWEYVENYNFAVYLKGHIAQVMIGLFGILGTAIMARALGFSLPATVSLALFLLCIVGLIITYEYVREKRFWKSLADICNNATMFSQITSLVTEPVFPEGRIAYEAAERVTSLANAELTEAYQDGNNYRDYIELWIHEAKMPIAAAKLITDRLSGSDAAGIALELESIERQVEQALYFARAGNVANDYAIREVSLVEVAKEACKHNARFLISKNVSPHIEIDENLTVLSDKPWLLFIVGQVIVNSAKYGASNITFTAESCNEGTSHGRTVLEIKDDGVGICASDVPRVFDRGFTGVNGRKTGSATGMGLYLIAVMCSRLGIDVFLASDEGKGTRVVFTFPHNRRSYIYVRDE